MAFDKPTRNRLASIVGKARDLIADEFTQQFQSLYGISDKGTITPLEQLGHLDDTGLATAALLRERIDYLVKTHPNDREGIKAAVARLAREQAFTVLNRLAAIRMAEKRGLIVESVGKGYQSKGFKVFEQIAGAGLGDTFQRYCRYLFCLFDELAVDLGVLFDRRSPQGLIFPRETALQALFTLLNASDIDPLWTEDETIGWIYQYYNDPAERKKMRDESAAPRNSRELAVRNQFFTPRYVVEFLTDNTLGRIWYEMIQGKTRLKDQCRYLVRRSTEIFLKLGETAPITTPQEGLSQEELLKQPVYIPYRPFKDPRKIGLLDPACGSMHFGLYAFDLFEALYEEAWDLGLKSLRLDYPEKEVFLREVPRLIIEHNIHGIDIDPRATQIAGLSLWLRAQKSWQAQHVPAAERPRIMRSNIVCAEPMPGSTELLKEFTATLQPPLLGQLVEKVFDQMQLAGEAGSLLKIEEEIATLVKVAKKLWQAGPKAEQTELSLGLEAKPKRGEFPLDVSGISDERFWETAEERIYAALRAYAEQAESGSYQRRLFAEDASRGFAFVDLCRKRYDVVVMNPPFGEFSSQTEKTLGAVYPEAKNDIYPCFVLRGVELLLPKSVIGAISSRTWLSLSSFSKWRRYVLKNTEPNAIIDLGRDVLDDANVQVCAYCLRNGAEDYSHIPFINLLSDRDKEVALYQSLLQILAGKLPLSCRLLDKTLFISIEGTPFAYQAPYPMLVLSGCKQILSQRGVSANQGIGASTRFHRLFWEVPPDGVVSKKWLPMAHGSSPQKFYKPTTHLFLWDDDGKEAKADVCHRYPYLNGNYGFKIQAEETYTRPGLCYGKRTERFTVQVMPAKHVFSFEGTAIFSDCSNFDYWTLLALLNSSAVAFWLNCVCAEHKAYNYVNAIPAPNLKSLSPQLGFLARKGWSIQRHRDYHNLTSTSFVLPSLLLPQVNAPLSSMMEEVSKGNRKSEQELEEVSAKIDELCAVAYGISETDIGENKLEVIAENDISDDPDDDTYLIDGDSKGWIFEIVDYALGSAFGRWDIRFATGERQPPELPDPFAPLPICPPGMLQNAAGLPAEPKNVPAHYPLRISWPGILVDDENHPEDIVARIREAIEAIWKERADAIEQEACELLGVKTLRDYFRRPAGFFADHLKRYSKSRRQAPIYWPLSTAKGSYTLWIYYHRLTDQTLHTALADFVDPKLKDVRAEIIALRESATHRTRLEELLDMEKELADFHTEIERIIKLSWKPNLNDGVLITASPLWALFRLPKWQKDLKACWEKLEKGDFDWAHLAYSIWPERVEKVCKKDRSIAIAHSLEHLCEAAPPKAKSKRKKATMLEESEP